MEIKRPHTGHFKDHITWSLQSGLILRSPAETDDAGTQSYTEFPVSSCGVEGEIMQAGGGGQRDDSETILAIVRDWAPQRRSEVQTQTCVTIE